ncbi:MAG: dihydrolipoyl dehydrogenase [Bdellovibrionales bacterium]|nr:dihydrolipoyl dehydrogenase [Bdellovibrionales bacterium]
MKRDFDVIVIGAGPGGYVAAIRSAQMGLNTAIVEKEYLGGVCLNVGCIPSKAMINASKFFHKANHDAAVMGFELSGELKLNMEKLNSWKQTVCDKMSGGVKQLLKGNSVTIINGDAQFVSPNEIEVSSSEGNKKYSADHYIVATGSRPIEIPGFSFDEKKILSSTGALDLNELPKRLIVIGGGVIGLEIGTYLKKLGTEVVVLEGSNSLFGGHVDKDCTQVIARKLKKMGVSVHLNARAKSCVDERGGVVVTADIDGKEKQFEGDKVLLVVGRKPNSDSCGLEKAGVQIGDRGLIPVDPQMRTNVSHIYAIGDLVGTTMLAHKASHEGVIAAEVIAGHNRVFDAKTIPAVIFTDPELASAGWTEEECKTHGHKDLKIGKFPYAANGKAVSLMETDGFVKIIADANTHVILGVHIVGPEASNLISEAVLALEMGAVLEDLALSIHPHPTLGETMMECAEAAIGHAIHIIQKPIANGNGASRSGHLST